MKYILALDLGTTGNRAIVFDHAGRAVGLAYKKFKQYYPQPGWVEQDPMEIWKSAVFVMREAVKKARVKPAQIAAMGITNQRETTVVWNARTGKPVYPAIVWQDRRTAEECVALKKRGLEPMIRQKTGLVLDPYFSATKVAWILKHIGRNLSQFHNPSQPPLILRGGALKFGTIDSWILWNLTKGKVHATDVSNASRTMLFNIQTLKWDDELLKFFKVSREILPEVRPSSGEFGVLDASVLGAPISIAGVIGDQQAALFGQTCFRRGELKVTYGTGAFLVLNVGSVPVIPHQKLLATIAWQIGDRVTYALEGSVFSCGAAQNWLQNNLGLIKNGPDADRLAGRVPDSGGVTVVPAFSGLGTPYWNPDARGVVSGLSLQTRREHIVRATLEAIAQQVTDVIEVMRKETGLPIREIRVDGGVARSDIVLQYQADLARLRVERAAQSESTALGAAMLAGLATGFWRFDELRGISTTTQTLNPQMRDRARGQLREQWQHAVAQACSVHKKSIA